MSRQPALRGGLVARQRGLHVCGKRNKPIGATGADLACVIGFRDYGKRDGGCEDGLN